MIGNISRTVFVNDPILRVEKLKKYFPVKSRFLKLRIGSIKAVDDVSLNVFKGEVMGLVGESGCGKSTLAKTILGLYQSNGGQIIFKNRVISTLPPEETRRMRREIQYVYQDAGASLDSWWTTARLLREPLAVHTKLSRSEMDEKALAMLQAVGMSKEHLNCYPHEFSGGQLRRLGLARILTLNPELIMFDEPTAGLDVSVQAKILELLKNLKGVFNLTYIMISHNLSVIRMISHRIAVMYLGKIVEMGPTESVFEEPKHPYTRILLDAVSEPGAGRKPERLLLSGEPPSADNIPPGCRFHPRCPFRQKRCEGEEPASEEIVPGHSASCHEFTTSPKNSEIRRSHDE